LKRQRSRAPGEKAPPGIELAIIGASADWRNSG
jgi:hypothetical protein